MLNSKISINQLDIEIKDDDKTKKLLEIGILEKDIISVGNQAFLLSTNSTKNDRNNAAGNTFSTTIFKGLVETQGWQKQNQKGIEFIYNPTTKMAIIPYRGSPLTGVDIEWNATTNSPRGSETKLPFSSNPTTANQVDWIPIDDSNVCYLDIAKRVHYLLYFLDKQKEEIRFELSCPKSKNFKGYPNDWHDRIFLEPISFNQTPSDLQNFDSQDIDIEVELHEK